MKRDDVRLQAAIAALPAVIDAEGPCYKKNDVAARSFDIGEAMALEHERRVEAYEQLLIERFGAVKMDIPLGTACEIGPEQAAAQNAIILNRLTELEKENAALKMSNKSLKIKAANAAWEAMSLDPPDHID